MEGELGSVERGGLENTRRDTGFCYAPVGGKTPKGTIVGQGGFINSGTWNCLDGRLVFHEASMTIPQLLSLTAMLGMLET